MDKIELAKWLHDNYEEVAKQQGWNTQEKCKVEFATLPDANKQTMIDIAGRLLNFNVLRQYFVIKSLPDSGEIRMKALELDEKDFAQWMYELQKGNVL